MRTPVKQRTMIHGISLTLFSKLAALKSEMAAIQIILQRTIFLPVEAKRILRTTMATWATEAPTKPMPIATYGRVVGAKLPGPIASDATTTTMATTTSITITMVMMGTVITSGASPGLSAADIVRIMMTTITDALCMLSMLLMIATLGTSSIRYCKLAISKLVTGATASIHPLITFLLVVCATITMQ